MNALSTLGSNFQKPIVVPQVLSQSLTSDGKRGGALQFPTMSGGNNVELSDVGKALAQQNDGNLSSLLQRASDFGSATLEAATKFVSNFAESVLGDAAKGMTLSFDTTSLSASSRFSSALQHTEGSNGTSDAAAMSLEDASDFLGKGTITTADGHRFSFEVEVHFKSTQEMSASTSSSTRASNRGGNAGGDTARVSGTAPDMHQHRSGATREGLAAHFPGSVADLLKMFDQGSLNLSFQGPTNNAEEGATKLGDMKLRLLSLLTNPDAMAGKLANAYGDIPSSGTLAAA